MTQEDRAAAVPVEGETDRLQVDRTTAQGARVADYLLGGGAYFNVDRKAVEDIIALLPGGADTGRTIVQAASDFRRRAVHYLATTHGVDQFLHIGTGIPRQGITHQVAQEVLPSARVAYCISDPVVLAHAHQLKGSPEGMVTYFQGDACNPDGMLEQASATLDLARPVAVLLALTFVADDRSARRTAAELLGDLAPDSHLVVANLASDISTDAFSPAIQYLADSAAQQQLVPMVARDHAEMTSLFSGLTLLEPGVVPVDGWQPDDATPGLPDGLTTPVYGGVGQKAN